MLSTLRAKPILLSNLLGEIHPKYYIVILGIALKDYLRQSFSTSFKQVQNDFQSLYVRLSLFLNILQLAQYIPASTNYL